MKLPSRVLWPKPEPLHLCCRPAQPVNNAVMSRNLSWSLDAADALAPAASPGAGDAAARVSPQSWGLYRQLTVADAC